MRLFALLLTIAGGDLCAAIVALSVKDGQAPPACAASAGLILCMVGACGLVKQDED